MLLDLCTSFYLHDSFVMLGNKVRCAIQVINIRGSLVQTGELKQQTESSLTHSLTHNINQTKSNIQYRCGILIKKQDLGACIC